MKQALSIRMFAHSWISDWNHGNAHFLRGLARELVSHGAPGSLLRGDRRMVAEQPGAGGRSRLAVRSTNFTAAIRNLTFASTAAMRRSGRFSITNWRAPIWC